MYVCMHGTVVLAHSCIYDMYYITLSVVATVPAQHAFKGILNLLMDKDDMRARELRARYVFKLIPMLNPDGLNTFSSFYNMFSPSCYHLLYVCDLFLGVFRGHFRMDQHGQNLNRYYTSPDSILQPAIFAAKSLTDFYASTGMST